MEVYGSHEIRIIFIVCVTIAFMFGQVVGYFHLLTWVPLALAGIVWFGWKRKNYAW
jgi:hypothetical protein